jgi:hypothetical protein
MSAELVAGLLQQEADLRTLRGWLALEAGDIERASTEVKSALRLSGGDRPLPLRSRGLALLCRELLSAGGR